jgi:adenosylmethionine-8-amino-7-oxononanoate aminotransferase
MLSLRASSLIREEGAMVRGIRDLIAISPPLIIRLMRLTNFSIAYVVDWTDSGIDERFSYGVHS